MPYIESVPTRQHVYLLIALFPVLYLVNLGTRELRRPEALQATIANEMTSTSRLAITTVHGEHVNSFPLYPWLVKTASAFQRANDWTARIPAALGVLSLAALSGWAAYSNGGALAGCVAASMALTCVAAFRAGVRAGPDTVFASLVAAAWLVWYHLGRERKRWGVAWTVVMLLLLAAVFTVGARALACFYLPILCLRRPLRGWRRMLFPAHFAALAGLAAVVLVWCHYVPEQTLLPWNTLRAVPRVTSSYPRELLLFPLKSAAYLLPWSFLAWPAFCVAYRPLEKKPVYCDFLRVLVYSLFLAAWLLPNISPRALLPLVCPLSVLTGLHYETLVRRHARALGTLCRLLGHAARGSAVLFLLAGGLHLSGAAVLSGLSAGRCGWSMLLLLAAGALVWWLRKERWPKEPWACLLLATAAVRLVYLAVLPTSGGWLHAEKRNLGTVLRQDIPKDAIVYKTLDSDLLVECFYLKRATRRVREPDRDLPTSPAAVFVLGGGKPPIAPARTWTACSPPVDPNRRATPVFRWFLGGARLLSITPGATLGLDRGPKRVVRLYRGNLR